VLRVRRLPLCVVVFIFMALVPILDAQAQQRGTGLGFLFGEPAGVSAKFWRTSKTAISAGMGWSFVDNGAVDLHVDHVWHNWSMLNVERGKLPLYFGVGGRLALDDHSKFGVRAPVGLDYLFPSNPVDLFVEIVPVLQLAPNSEWDFNGAFGLRYFFGRTHYRAKSE